MNIVLLVGAVLTSIASVVYGVIRHLRKKKAHDAWYESLSVERRKIYDDLIKENKARIAAELNAKKVERQTKYDNIYR